MLDHQEPEIIINFGAPSPTLHRFSESRAYMRIIRGPLGSAKTTQCCQEMVRLACSVPPWDNGVRRSRMFAMRNTKSELLSTTIADFQEAFGAVSKFSSPQSGYPYSHITMRLDDGTYVDSILYYIHAEGTRAQIESRLRGLNVTFGWFNELKELPFMVVSQAMSRVGRYPRKDLCQLDYYGCIGDTNSPDTDHWLYKVLEEQHNPDWDVFHQPPGVLPDGEDGYGRRKWRVNPDADNLHNLPNNYYTYALQGKTEDWIKVNLANQYGFVQDGRPIYGDDFGDIHVAPVEYNPDLPLVIGADFGFSPAAAFVQIAPSGTVNIIDEMTSDYMLVPEFGEALKSHINANYPQAKSIQGIGDPSGVKGERLGDRTELKMISEASGVPFRPAHSNALASRIGAVRTCLQKMHKGQPGIRINPHRCPTLIKGFRGGYCFKRVAILGADKYKDEPDKNMYSHVHDALQYAFLGLGKAKELMGQAVVMTGRKAVGTPRGYKVW